jgi:aldose 1-epimerase
MVGVASHLHHRITLDLDDDPADGRADPTEALQDAALAALAIETVMRQAPLLDRERNAGMELNEGEAAVALDPARGGRVASLRVAGHELLVAEAEVGGDPTLWGCYPMVPWAGRVRAGRFAFRGRTHQLPLDAPPHALHGVGYRAAWEATGPSALRLDLDGLWPLGGTVTQEVTLTPTSLRLTMAVTAAGQAMPVMAGWHPCFRRRLDTGGPVVLDVPATSMWERDGVGIPNGRQVPVPPGPWDDAFAGMEEPKITWPDGVAVTLRSTCPVWVVYDQDPRLICIEPQTDAPDAFNRDPTVLEPGDQLAASLEIDWSRPRETLPGGEN